MLLSKEFQFREGEKIEKIIYHHLIIIIPHLVVCFLILILDFFLMYYLLLQGWWGAALFAAVIIISAVYVFRLMFLYRRNKMVVTNERIVDFEQRGFFEKFINEFPYVKVREARAVIKGVLPTIFHYGNLEILIEEDNLIPFELYKVSRPFEAQNIINQLIENKRPPQMEGRGEEKISADRVLTELNKLNEEEKKKIVEKLMHDSL